MAFGGSGWAGGLREARGRALAVDMVRGLLHLVPLAAPAPRGDGGKLYQFILAASGAQCRLLLGLGAPQKVRNHSSVLALRKII